MSSKRYAGLPSDEQVPAWQSECKTECCSDYFPRTKGQEAHAELVANSAHSLQELVHERHGDLDIPDPPLLWRRLPGLIRAQRGDHLHSALVIADLPWIWSSVWWGLALYLQSAGDRAFSTTAWME